MTPDEARRIVALEAASSGWHLRDDLPDGWQPLPGMLYFYLDRPVGGKRLGHAIFSLEMGVVTLIDEPGLRATFRAQAGSSQIGEARRN